MFEVGDYVRVKDEVSEQVLMTWCRTTSLENCLRKDGTHRVGVVNSNEASDKLPGTVGLDGSFFLFPSAFFEKVEEDEFEVAIYECELTEVVDQQIKNFLDDIILNKITIVGSHARITYTIEVTCNEPGEKNIFETTIPEHIVRLHDKQAYAINKFILFLAEQWREEN